MGFIVFVDIHILDEATVVVDFVVVGGGGVVVALLVVTDHIVFSCDQ